MDTDVPHSSAPPAMAPPGPAANVLQAMSRSASCAMEGDAVLRKGEAALAGAPRTDTTAVAATPSDVRGTPKQHESVPATDAAAAGKPLSLGHIGTVICSVCMPCSVQPSL